MSDTDELLFIMSDGNDAEEERDEVEVEGVPRLRMPGDILTLSKRSITSEKSGRSSGFRCHACCSKLVNSTL